MTRFVVSRAALELVSTLGGSLHCFVGGEGCRARSLVFTTDEPRRAVAAVLDVPPEADEVDWEGTDWTPERLATLADRVALADCRLTVAQDLLPLLDGALLDVVDERATERFVWARLAGDVEKENRRCTCLRSLGSPRGKRATCLDDARQGLVPLT